MTTNLAVVDLQLLSVSQMLHNGSKVVLPPESCYMEYKSGRRDKLEQRDGLFIMKLWVPRCQKPPVTPFQGRA